MHYLHKILVHIPTATDLDSNAPKEDLLKEIISHAKGSVKWPVAA